MARLATTEFLSRIYRAPFNSVTNLRATEPAVKISRCPFIARLKLMFQPHRRIYTLWQHLAGFITLKYNNVL